MKTARELPMAASTWAFLLSLAFLAATPAHAATVWAANDNEVLQLDISAGRVVARIPMSGVTQLAATSDGGAWALRDGKVLAIAPDNTLRATIAVEATGYGPGRLLAADGYDGSVWVVTNRNLLIHYDENGTLLTGRTWTEPIQALDIALDQTVWLVAGGAILHVSPTVEVLDTIDAAALRAEAVSSIAVDSLHDRLWIVGQRGVQVVDLRDLAAPPRSIAFDPPIDAAALHAGTGTLWVFAGARLTAYDQDQRITETADVGALGLSRHPSAFIHAGDGFAVLASTKGIGVVELVEDTKIATRIDEDVTLIARPAFRVAPRLALVRPPIDSSTGEQRPTFILQFDGACEWTRCDLGPSYLSSYDLIASLDGASVGMLFERDPVTQRATYTPVARLSFGRRVFTAQATDRFGHTSNRIESTLDIIDLDSAGPNAGTGASASEAAPKSPSTAIIKGKNNPPTVTMTSPSPGSSFTAGSNITLSANAADSDGTVSKVDFYRGGTTLIGTVTAAPYTFSWNSVAVGSYSLTAKATDNKGAATTSSPAVAITVVSNSPPTVTMTAPSDGAFYLVGTPITVSASASDTDGTIAKVEFYAGATLLATVNAPPYSTTWSSAPLGNYVLTAKATDNQGAVTSSAPVNVAVGQPPQVVMVTPSDCVPDTGPVPDYLLLADAASVTGYITKVEFFEGTTLIGTAARISLTAWGGEFLYHWLNVPNGTHVITAKATDDHGNTATSHTAILTIVPPNQLPTVSITSPTDGAVFGPAPTIAIAANASDSDGTIARVEFWLNSSLIRTLTVSPYTFNLQGVAAGSYSLFARAYDDRGGSNQTPLVHYSVAANAPPSVSLTAPADGASCYTPATISLAASASDTDGSIAKVDFYEGSTLIGTATSAPYSLQWTGVAAGNYSLTAKATDNLGAATTSAPVNVTVNPNSAPTVSVTEPAAAARFYVPATIRISAVASDSDGSVARVDFYASGTLVGSATASPFSIIWSNPPAGTFSITAVATDNVGAVTTSPPVTVTINGAVTVAVAPGLDGSTIADDNTLISGTIAAPQNSGVTINGQPAQIDPNGNFYANAIPLTSGANTISVSLVSQNGQSATQSVTITSSGLAPFLVVATPTDGFAPLDVNFEVTNRGNVAFQRIEVDFDGDGTPDLTAPATDFVDGVLEVTGTYPAGTFLAKTNVFDANNVVIFSSTQAVTVRTPTDAALFLYGIYTGMLDQLRVGDTTGALNAILPSMRTKYGAVFSLLQPNLATIVDQLGTVIDGTVSGEVAEFLLTRNTANGPRTFAIHLLRDGDGVWRIEGM